MFDSIKRFFGFGKEIPLRPMQGQIWENKEGMKVKILEDDIIQLEETKDGKSIILFVPDLAYWNRYVTEYKLTQWHPTWDGY